MRPKVPGKGARKAVSKVKSARPGGDKKRKESYFIHFFLKMISFMWSFLMFFFTHVGTFFGNHLKFSSKASGNMAMVKTNTFSQYRLDVESIVTSLITGLHSFATFVNKSTSLTDGRDEMDYIAHVLKPTADKAKYNFDQMKKCGHNLLDKVNRDFEKSTNDVEQMKREIKNMDTEFVSLTEELKGKERDLAEAQKQCDKKRTNLRRAKDALSEATKKLDAAETAQEATEAAGYTTAVVSAVVSIVFLPALIGVAAGTTIGVIGSTALRAAKKGCEHSVESAKGEISSSKKDFEYAKQNKRSTEQLLLGLSYKNTQAEYKLSLKQNELEELQTFQRYVITMNENIKMLVMNLSRFHGHFDVLHHEIRGGYSISLLRNPTMTVCGSLSTLLTCHALYSLCEPSKLDEMNQQIHQIQSAEWPKSIANPDDDDEMSLI